MIDYIERKWRQLRILLYLLAGYSNASIADRFEEDENYVAKVKERYYDKDDLDSLDKFFTQITDEIKYARILKQKMEENK